MKKLLLFGLAALLALAQEGNQRAAISFSADSGDIQIIAAAQPGRAIRVYKIVMSFAATTDITYVQGTGTNCGTGRTVISGVMKTVQSIIDITPQNSLLAVSNAQALCINLSSATTGGGYVIYSN